ncbi:hypothetical protein ACFUJX_20180 [Streptomyces rubiginosohelvolus]|uniref:hypothetical protein n=1 Tax=Streptomyces rubiginosohelvolus TaxID=67362 RepID=UPI0036347E9F
MTAKYGSPAVRQLAAVVERVAPRDQARWEGRLRVPGAGGVPVRVSEQRARQLWALVGMFDRAVGRPEVAGGRVLRSVGRLFAPEVLDAVFGLAVAGELRHRAEDRGRALPVASQRVFLDCVALLAPVAAPGVGLVLPVLPQPELKPTLERGPLEALYRGMVDLAAQGPLSRDGAGLSYEQRSRLLAMVAILLDAAPRSGELAALGVADLAAGEVAVGVRRRQQKGPAPRREEIAALAEVHPETVRAVMQGRLEARSEATRQRVLAAVKELGPPPEVEWYPLREGSRVAVRRWLEVRKQVVESLPLTGSRRGLWVTLQASVAGPPGVTLSPDGVRRSYAKGITALNWVMAGSRGWEPLPVRMEQVRRSVSVVPLDGPPGG